MFDNILLTLIFTCLFVPLALFDDIHVSKAFGFRFHIQCEIVYYPEQFDIDVNFPNWLSEPLQINRECDSCTAIMTMNHFSWLMSQQYSRKLLFSPQEAVDCGMPDCEEKMGVGKMFDYIRNVQFPTLAKDYPYVDKHQKCQRKQHPSPVDIHDWVLGSTEIELEPDPEAVKYFLKKGPVLTVVDMSDEFDEYHVDTPTLFEGKCDSTGKTDHVVMLYGWGKLDGIAYWKILNNRGSDWGYKGFAYLRQEMATGSNVGKCGVNAEIWIASLHEPPYIGRD